MKKIIKKEPNFKEDNTPVNNKEEFYKKQAKMFETRLLKEIEYSESLKTKLALEETQRKLYELECTRLTEKLNKNFFKRLFDF
jgi:hypothetical protein